MNTTAIDKLGIAHNVQGSCLPLYGLMDNDWERNVLINMFGRAIDTSRPCYAKDSVVNPIIYSSPLMYGLFFVSVEYIDKDKKAILHIFDVTGVVMQTETIRNSYPMAAQTIAKRKANEWVLKHSQYYTQNLYLAIKREHLKALRKAVA